MKYQGSNTRRCVAVNERSQDRSVFERYRISHKPKRRSFSEVDLAIDLATVASVNSPQTKLDPRSCLGATLAQSAEQLIRNQ
jgi:hypothetical protein